MKSRYVLIACLAVLLVAAPAVAETEPVSAEQSITMTVMPVNMLSVSVQDHLHFHLIAGYTQSHGFNLNFTNTTSSAWVVTVEAANNLRPVHWDCPDGPDPECTPVWDDVATPIDIGVLSIVFDLPGEYSGWGPDWGAEGIGFSDVTLSTGAQTIVTGAEGAIGSWGIGHNDQRGVDELRMDLDLSGHEADSWLDYGTTLTYTIQTVTTP